jgi:hypothetical protein
MNDQIESEIVANGSVGADGTIVVARGFTYSAAAHTADTAGIYNLVLDRACNSAECVVQVTPRTTEGIAFSTVHTSDTVKQVNARTIDAHGAIAPADCAFDVTVVRNSGGVGR